MGRRGPPPKPSAVRAMEGMKQRAGRGSVNEPRHISLAPKKPHGMTPAAGKIWDRLVSEMEGSGVLRVIDWMALGGLCEDQAMLDQLRVGLKSALKRIQVQAKEQGVELKTIGDQLSQFTITTGGRRLIGSIRELTTSLIVQRREFGLTPASNTRVEAQGAGGLPMDSIERALCGTSDEFSDSTFPVQ